MAFNLDSLTDINFKLSQMAGDATLMKQYQPQIEALKIVKANQTASMNPVLNELARKDKNMEGKVYVNFLTGLSGEDEPVEPNCAITGDPLSSDSKPYDLTMEFKKDFEIDEDAAKDHIFSVEEQEAHGIMDMFRILDEGYAKRLIAKLDAFAGTNLFLGSAPYTNANGATQIPAADYNVKLFPYLAQAAIINRLNNYYLIDNGSLFAEKFLADVGQVKDGVSNANLYNQFKIAFDLINFAKAGIPTDTLLVDANSVFFATKTRYTNAVPEQRKADQFVSVRTSPFSGIQYDLISERVCRVVNGKDHMVRVHRLQTKGDLLQAPEQTYPGVLAFDKV